MVIMLFVLLFFGSKKIPDLARGLGRGMREFKDAMNGVQTEIRQGMKNVETNITEELPQIEPDPLSVSNKPVSKDEAVQPSTEKKEGE